MANDHVSTAEGPTLDGLRRLLADISRSASPRVAELALWARKHPEEMAFHSVRGLASLAGVNPNTVFRLARAMGYEGFDACRLAFQEALRGGKQSYARRASYLQHTEREALFGVLASAARSNIDAVFGADMAAKIEAAVTALLSARQVYCVGVRSCYSVAHYFTYTGRMAFENFAALPAEPGAIADAMTTTGPEDVVVPVSYALYSVETVRAHEIARARGARIISITDSAASPLADGAELVLTPRMDGPHALPSHLAYFALVEALVAGMVARTDAARTRIEDFEQRLTRHGAYIA